MNKFIHFLIAGVFATCSLTAMAQNIPDCKHDVAPYDTGRYARDMKLGNVMSTTKIPSRTIWETNMKGGKFIVCRTTQERTVAIMKDNTFYDIDCGNEVKIALPPRDVVSRLSDQPGTTTITAGQKCSGVESCKKVDWCDANNGWVVEGSERVCRIPGQVSRIVQEDVLNIDQHLTVNPRVLTTTVNQWEGNGNFSVPPPPQARGDVAGSQGPQVNMGQSSNGNVSGKRCAYDCVGGVRPTVTDVVGMQNIPSAQCEIRWKKEISKSELAKLGDMTHEKGFLIIRRNDGTASVQGRILLDQFKNKAGENVVRLASVVPTSDKPLKVSLSPWKHSNDCREDKAITKKNWQEVVKHLNLPDCAPQE